MVDALDGRLQVFAIDHAGAVTPYDEVSHAYAGSLYICRVLATTYDVQLDAWGVYRAQELGKLFGSPRLSLTDSILLGFTGTHCWVRRENVPRLVDAIDDFWRKHHNFTTLMGQDVEAEPTLPRVAQVLRRAAQDEALRGVCFNQTSVVTDPWRAPFEPGKPYNFDRDRFTVSGVSPWELFDELAECRERHAAARS
jgi:hypothetical protein